MNRISRDLLLPLVLALGVLAACGDDDDDDDGGQQPPPPAGVTVRLATLNGAQETPAVTTTALGAGALSVDASTGRVRGFVVTSGLVAANAAHVHLAARGTPGNVIVPMTGGPQIWLVPDNATPLTAEQRAAFTAGNLYFNVHTDANPNGEIRGQLDKAGTIRVTTLNGAQETPAVTTTALGAGMLSVDAATGAVAGFVVHSEIPTANVAHVHEQARGTAGEVRVPLQGGPGLWVVPDNATPLSEALRTAFTNGTLYFNVHSPANPNGEIRGQLDKPGTVRLASLNGAQETPPVTTTALGGGALSVDAAAGTVSGFVVHTGIPTANVAHVHEQARGTAGDVRVPLQGGPGLWVVPDNATPLSDALRTAFTNGNLYFNVHSPANPNGEIRGQLD